MNRPKTGKPGGRDEPIEDPQVLQDSLRMLFESETEFSIKVEGTSTLPYASILLKILPEPRELILKLVRPLPHELMSGAVFRMVFAVDDQRYEALITYGGREAYLQYRFSQPEHLFHADRRRHKRFPFRPRESAYVIASDGGIPGLGVAGPLVNIGLGGLCLRVDRVLKLDDGVRVPVSTALFDRGSSFPRIRIQDLPRLPLLEVTGRVTHASERGSEILLGFHFGDLAADQAQLLSGSLALREKMFQSRAGGGSSDSPGAVRTDSGSYARSPQGRDESLLPAQASAAPFDSAGDPLFLLRRKTARLMLIAAEGPQTERCQRWLWNSGYHRVEVLKDFDAAQRHWQSPGRSRPQLLMVDLALALFGDQEPLAGVRNLERQLVAFPGVPAVILCEEVDPTLFLGQSDATRILPLGEDEALWISALDDLLGLSVEPA